MSAPQLLMPPHNISAEQSVLGALMLQQSALTLISDWLPESAFYRKSHRVIYRAISDLAGKQQPTDAVTLGEWFDSHGLIEIIGDDDYPGTSYILHLANTTPSAANVVAYAEIVLERARLRRAVDIGTTLTNAALATRAESGVVIATATHELAQLQHSTSRGGLVPVRQGVKEWFADLHKKYDAGNVVTGMPTPWHDLNKATHGFQDCELVIIAGRPSMGKSIFGDSIAIQEAIRLKASDAGGQALIFALETSKEKVVRRAVSRIASIPHDWLVAPVKGEEDESWWPRITSAAGILATASLQIDDQGGLTADEICARALRAHLQSPVRLVVIDHLHLVGIDGKNVAHEIGQNTAKFKGLAKKLNCPVIVLAQLNRAGTERSDRRPTMTDLRASGNIEQDADVIIFIHREDYYDRDSYLRGVVEAAVAKGRDLPAGTIIHLQNEYQFMRASDWVGPLPEPPREQPSKRSGGWSPSRERASKDN